MKYEVLEQIVEQIKKNSAESADKVREAISAIVSAASPVWVTGDAKKLFEKLNEILESTGPTMESATEDTIKILENAYNSMLEAAGSESQKVSVSSNMQKIVLTVDVSSIKEYDGGILGSTDELKNLIDLIVKKEQEIEETIKGYSSTIQGLAADFFANIGSKNASIEEAVEDLYNRLLDAFAKLFHILNSDDESLTKAVQTCIDKYDEAQAAIANAVKGVSVN